LVIGTSPFARQIAPDRLGTSVCPSRARLEQNGAFSAIASPEIDQLAVRIAGEDADTEILKASRKVAEAQISLTRVRLIKYLTLEIASGRGSVSRALRDKNLDWFMGPNRWVANLVRTCFPNSA